MNIIRTEFSNTTIQLVRFEAAHYSDKELTKGHYRLQGITWDITELNSQQSVMKDPWQHDPGNRSGAKFKTG